MYKYMFSQIHIWTPSQLIFRIGKTLENLLDVLPSRTGKRLPQTAGLLLPVEQGILAGAPSLQRH